VNSNATPGATLKRLRVEKGWKLADLAARTGFPISTLSKMENGKISLTYDKLARVSKALEVDIGVFFAPARETAAPATGTGRRSIMRAGEGQEIETSAYHHLYQATDLLNKRFIPMIAYPHARSMEEFGDWVRHPGEEYAYIIEGAVDFYSELYAPVRLEQGDSIYFDSSMGHAYLAVGDKPSRGLIICAGDESLALPIHEKAAPAVAAEPQSPPQAKPAVGQAPGPRAPKVVRKARADA
jgi:transcriptional regulator with XRE-family HTH domain